MKKMRSMSVPGINDVRRCIRARSAAAPKAKTKKAAAAAAASKPPMAMKMDVTSVLERNLKNLEDDVVPAADAMPEDKYNFKPTNDLIKGSEFTGVKTYSDQVKHIAVTNELVVACLNGQPQPVPDAESDLGPAKLTSKADIMQYLKDSFTHAHEAFAKINKANIDGQVRNPFGKGRGRGSGSPSSSLATPRTTTDRWSSTCA